ncbi:hypothetical protein [Sulfurospirillum multivorans]|uniref:Uncharacterized protein n=2 Tax=Sulfurospirillum multivorans TaxID=66821 RepID=A0AA86E0U7_SULMK|nr:hypothetical protein [Sulfurospirillum multivorans]AHJ14365.1 hypothetical protein SMUL_3139 [Sulfurospirillum multivorans DSM 12446]QEH07850.1 hypothetical protein SMN_3101 [Sulfurospirillum multivorans]
MKYSEDFKLTTAIDLHNIIIVCERLDELDEKTLLDFQRLSRDTELLFSFKDGYDSDPLLAGRFYEDMSMLEKIFSCTGVDLEKEFPKS